ncbi:MAG: rhodanese-like domain-containing protein [Candidatus Hydrothermarchaeaceae archaeon]
MRKLLLIVLAFVLVFLVALGLRFGVVSNQNSSVGPQEITPQQLKTMMKGDGDFVLLDVRTPLEYEQGHIPGAILVPSYETEKIEGLGIPKDKKIVVYCSVNPRSTKSVKEFSEMGYTNLLRLKGGVYEWRKADGELIKSAAQETVEPSPTTPAPTAAATAPTTTTPPLVQTTAPPTTQPPQESSAWTAPEGLEPNVVIPVLEGSRTLEMGLSYTLLVGDGILHLEVEEIDGCVYQITWKLSVYEKTVDGANLEGSVDYTTTRLDVPFPSKDISQDIHETSDALDDYTIVVDEWGSEWVRITITR